MTLNLLSDNLIRRPQIVFDLGDLAGDAFHEIQIRRIRRRVSYWHKVIDLGLLGLAVSVDAPDALFKP